MKAAVRFVIAPLALFVFSLAAAPTAAFAVEEGEHGAQHEAASPAKTAGELEAGHGEGAGHGEAGHGEGHGGPSLDLGRLGAQLFNFAVLIAILYFGGRKAVSAALSARSNQIKTDLASAAEARAAAQARFEQQEKRLAALEHEIGAIAASIKQEAEAEKARLIAAAEDRARRIQDESAFIIDQQVKQAQEDLRREVAAAAVALAEKIVRNQLGPSDQQRLIDTFVGDVASGNGHHVGSPAGGSPAPAGRGAPRSEI